MADTEFDALEAVNIALQMERNGHKFYTEATKQTPHDTGKQMFTRLANDELAHIYWLMTVRQSLIKTGEFGDVESLLRAEPPSRLEVLPDFPLQRQGVTITPETRELEALELGIQAEIATAEFYADAAERTRQQAGRDLFKRLADWEHDHRRLLEAEHDYLEQNGFYLGMAEFQLEGPEYLSWWRR